MIVPQTPTHAEFLNCESTDNAATKILSNKPLTDWRGSLTTFKGFTGTLPVDELINVEWSEIVKLIRPEKPAYICDKKLGVFFVPCLLKEAQLVGATLAIAQASKTATIGKMRSKSHVTEAAMLIMDIDGLPEADFMAGLEKIKIDCITYLAFTTFSNGNPAKPGVRAQLVIPLDRPVNTDTYASVWHGFDNYYWQSQAGQADASGAKLYQQQGTWCCDSLRQGQELSWANDAGVASVNALITAVPDTSRHTNNCGSAPVSTDYPPSDANKVADTCQQIRMFRDTKGVDQSEPLWFDCLGVVGYCEDGVEVCQRWSSGHAGYCATETARKLAYRAKIPPTTCHQFRKTNPEGCEGCSQRCNSPITLGRKAMVIKTTEPVTSSKTQISALTREGLASEIVRLSTQTSIDYDQARSEVEKNQGNQVGILDSSMKEARNNIAAAESSMFPVVEPASEPVNPTLLFDEFPTIIKTYVAISDEQADAAALWIAMTWFIDVLKVAPLAIINAPEKACGKTQLLEILGRLSAKPLSTANISTAGLFRVTEKYAPTLLIDEADTFIKENN